MIVDDLHIDGAVTSPYEADAPLFIDANRMLSLAVAFERLQTIARRHPQIAERFRVVQHVELSSRYFGDGPEMLRKSPAFEKGFCGNIFEALDHRLYIVRTTYQLNAVGLEPSGDGGRQRPAELN